MGLQERYIVNMAGIKESSQMVDTMELGLAEEVETSDSDL